MPIVGKVQAMPIVNGYWQPTLSPKQAKVTNCRKRYLLVSGPKKSGKTLGCCHKVVDHAVRTDRGRVAIFAKTVKTAKDGGVWSDLVDIVIPEWLASDTGIRMVTPPKVDGQTRQLYCELSNRKGNKSRIVLNSLDFDGDIEEVIKGKRYSMIYFNELSNFKSRRVFDISIDQLRCVHLPYEAHQWMADTNPSDEGEDSWIYKLFYVERSMEDHPDPTFRNDMDLIEVMIEDNPFLNDRERANLIATFRHDEDLFNRYIKGIWTSSASDSHFHDIFRPEIHIVGNNSSVYEKEWDIMLPQDDCELMITGSDIGSSINHGIAFLEPARIDGVTVYKCLDEIVRTGEKIGLAELTDQWLERMDYWERVVGKKLQWRHWSDKSAFDAYRSAAETYDYSFVLKHSNGRLDLMAAPKFKDSVRQRVDTTRRLLFEDRLLISAKCVKMLTMMRSLKRGTGAANYVDRGSIHKHPFDALSYPLMAEAPMDLLPERIGVRTGRVALMG